MTVTFVGSASAPVGTAIHVTAYLGGIALDPIANPVTWTGMPASVTVTHDTTGYLFNSTAVQNGAGVTGTVSGGASGVFALTFTGLQFSSP